MLFHPFENAGIMPGEWAALFLAGLPDLRRNDLVRKIDRSRDTGAVFSIYYASIGPNATILVERVSRMHLSVIKSNGYLL
jgi:hypothetical protein